MKEERRVCYENGPAKQRRRKQRKKEFRRRIREMMFHMAMVFVAIAILIVSIMIGVSVSSDKNADAEPDDKITDTQAKESEITYLYIAKPSWEEQLLTPNEFSRPQTEIEKVTAIVVHYTGNPKTTAQQNRNYFESLAETGETSASSHYVVGLEGEIIQCIPLNEIAYASRHRNIDTISIEVCHPTEDGKFNEETYNSLVELVAWLMVEFELNVDDVIRHYDVTGKICPKYFVEHEDAWEDFKRDVEEYVNANCEERTKIVY